MLFMKSFVSNLKGHFLTHLRNFHFLQYPKDHLSDSNFLILSCLYRFQSQN